MSLQTNAYIKRSSRPMLSSFLASYFDSNSRRYFMSFGDCPALAVNHYSSSYRLVNRENEDKTRALSVCNELDRFPSGHHTRQRHGSADCEMSVRWRQSTIFSTRCCRTDSADRSRVFNLLQITQCTTTLWI